MGPDPGKERAGEATDDAGASGPAVTAVLIHYGAIDWCLAAVESLRASVGVALDIIVVDNSGDLPVLPEPPGAASVHLVRPGSNLGYAAGANVGLRRWLDGDGEYCLVAVHDLTVASDTIARLVDVGRSHPDFGVIAPWFTPRVARVGELGSDGEIVEFEWVSGSGYVFRRGCLSDVGLFDEDFGSYTEDRELCRRARINGWRVGAVPGAHASSRGSAHHDRSLVLMFGNQALLEAKYGSLPGAGRVVARELGGALRELVRAASPRRSTRRALRRSRIHLASAVHGVRQLLRWARRGGQRGDPLSAQRRGGVKGGPAPS